jgi:hypothetical protein
MKLLGSDYYICYFDGGAESGTNSYYFPYQIIGGTERFEGAAGRVESSGEYQSLWSNSRCFAR